MPQNLIEAIVESNETRKKYLAETINKILLTSAIQHPMLGVYRLAMKSGSDNFRKSAVLDIIKMINYPVCIYEPTINDNESKIMASSILGCEIVNDLQEFKKKCAVIITNRYDPELNDVKDKVYTRDIFNNN